MHDISKIHMAMNWSSKALKFLDLIHNPISGASTSVPGGNVTLYGTCYAALAKDYISGNLYISQKTREFLIQQQEPEFRIDDRA